MTDYWAHVVVDVVIEKPKELHLPGDYHPGAEIGDVLLRADNRGETVERRKDGPVTVAVSTVRIAKAQVDGEDVTFTPAGKRALALVQIGAKAEKTLREQIHAFADGVRDQTLGVEPSLATFRINELEKKFTR